MAKSEDGTLSGKVLEISRPRREKSGVIEDNRYRGVVRGVDYLSASNSQGTFFSTMSDSDYEERLRRAMDGEQDVDTDRHEMGLEGLLPREWHGKRISYVIRVEANIMPDEEPALSGIEVPDTTGEDSQSSVIPTPREVADKLHALREDPNFLVGLQGDRLRRARESGERRIRGSRS